MIMISTLHSVTVIRQDIILYILILWEIHRVSDLYVRVSNAVGSAR